MIIRINSSDEYELYNRTNIKYDANTNTKVLTFMVKVNEDDNGETIFDTLLDELKNLEFLTLVRDGEKDIDLSNYREIQSYSRVLLDNDDYIMVSLNYAGSLKWWN